MRFDSPTALFLKKLSAAHQGRKASVAPWATGIAAFDSAVGGGLALGRIHEFYAAERGEAA
jgi:RecA/RadA recombinase